MIEYSAKNGIARVTLNRPEKRNALNAALIAAIEEALAKAADDESVRVVLLRGNGPDFCAGLDLAGMLENPSPNDWLISMWVVLRLPAHIWTISAAMWHVSCNQRATQPSSSHNFL